MLAFSSMFPTRELYHLQTIIVLLFLTYFLIFLVLVYFLGNFRIKVSIIKGRKHVYLFSHFKQSVSNVLLLTVIYFINFW